MEPVRAWLMRLGEELAPLAAVAAAAPIVGGAVGKRVRRVRLAIAPISARCATRLRDAGFGESPLFTIDQPGDLAAGCIDGVSVAATFAPGDPNRHFESVRSLRAGAPLLCGEYWAGWFDHWGETHHRLDDAQQARDLEWMLHEACSFNIYMFHGGTNFGFWNGANSSETEPYQPTTTSYDYDAALDEAGRPTAKYALFREAIAAHSGVAPPAVPPAPQTVAIPPFALSETCALLDADLGEPILRDRPEPMELLGRHFGYVLYRTYVDGPLDGELEIDAVRDYAVVSLDDGVAGRLDRRLGESRLRVRCDRARTRLSILVENGGRINYGPDFPHEWKGVTRAVRLDGRELLGWQIHLLPLDELGAFAFTPFHRACPALHRGNMHVDAPHDTFVDVSALGKGALWINGRNVGRFWNIGPQRCAVRTRRLDAGGR